MRPEIKFFHRPARFWINIAVLALIFFLLTACGGGGEENPEEALPPAARTVCSDPCRAQGQCGDNAANQPVVLGMDTQPATNNHNQLFPHDANVVKLASQDKIVRHPVTNAEETWRFVQVQMVEGGQTGWVANMCLVDQ